jgi:protein O-GlcNAc transferase
MNRPCIPFINILPLDGCYESVPQDPFQKTVLDLLRRGNLPQADTLLRMSLEKDPNNPQTFNWLGWIASAVDQPFFANAYFSKAAAIAPSWRAPRTNIERLRGYAGGRASSPSGGEAKTSAPGPDAKYLLIKAWGFGFWSDVSHVLSQILLAEVTGRIPVVHWGPNSLFGEGDERNAFEFYFENVSDVTINDLKDGRLDIWPPKWNHGNLAGGELNKWEGPYSRVAWLYLLNRPERVVVSDFYSGVINIRPWIPPGHHLYGMTVDEIYRYLIRRYLRPKAEITRYVDDFIRQRIRSSSFIAVHARGSDKAVELKYLDEANQLYRSVIEGYLANDPQLRIFLMTDDSRVLEQYVTWYGERVIFTDCQRSSSSQGIHLQSSSSPRKLGFEVMVDTYVAARASHFVGNGFSNPSLIILYLKDWPDRSVCLIGKNMYLSFNSMIHNW